MGSLFKSFSRALASPGLYDVGFALCLADGCIKPINVQMRRDSRHFLASADAPNSPGWRKKACDIHIWRFEHKFRFYLYSSYILHHFNCFFLAINEFLYIWRYSFNSYRAENRWCVCAQISFKCSRCPRISIYEALAALNIAHLFYIKIDIHHMARETACLAMASRFIEILWLSSNFAELCFNPTGYASPIPLTPYYSSFSPLRLTRLWKPLAFFTCR